MNNKKAIILASGGLDSTTILYHTKKLGYEIYALSFDYGQRHNIELEFLKRNLELLNIKNHVTAKIDLAIFGNSALTSNDPIPEHALEDIGKSIPSTYVPARNTIFLSYALAYAEVKGANDIFIGANILDYSGYPDCRPEFLEAFETMSNLALAKTVEGKQKIYIHAPLLKMFKKDIITLGLQLGVDYQHTISCYNPIIQQQEVLFCGKCDACKLRLNAFKDIGINDPGYYL